MDKNWKVILAFAGVFLAGAVTGASVSTLWMHKTPPKPPAADLRASIEQYVRGQFATMTRKLDLTPEQHEQLRPALQHASEDFRTIRRNERQETVRILEKLHGEIVQVLTPEQQERFEKLRAQQRERIQRFLRSNGRLPGQPGEKPAHPADVPPPPPAGGPEPQTPAQTPPPAKTSP
jgi:Spy/CpxP family protein refolding chaperone